MNQNQLSPEQIENLINLASKKLGADPNTLKENLSKGNADKIIGNLAPAQQAIIAKLLKDPKAVESFMSTPQAQEFMNRIIGGK